MHDRDSREMTRPWQPVGIMNDTVVFSLTLHLPFTKCFNIIYISIDISNHSVNSSGNLLSCLLGECRATRAWPLSGDIRCQCSHTIDLELLYRIV